MKSLLTALQEGRLVELPDNSKDKALEYLALLIEAIPDIGTKTDLVKGVKDRESQFNSGLGNGIAIPHVRFSSEGELLCAIGWAPGGIDYGAKDGKKVYLLVMYYIPDSETNLYLKEISGLAKVIKQIDENEFFINIKDIQTLRDKLLDWIGIVINDAVPDSKAKMIKLDAKQASIESRQKETREAGVINRIIPFDIIVFDNGKYFIFSQDDAIVGALENSNELLKLASFNLEFELYGYKIAIRTMSSFAKNRKLYECIAVK
jgi:mannitol/fructose-specific phosphotransferase system IIA component (Ntr-type)